MATGLAIPEWRPLDQQAWDELRLLTSNVFRVVA